MDLLKSRVIKVKVIRGVYGSGKDMLMLHEALSLIEKEIFQRIIYVRPPVTVANVPDIGYLPGDMIQKLYWTLGPIYDKVGGDSGIQSLIQ
jgi:predicted ribonuclease YlaK